MKKFALIATAAFIALSVAPAAFAQGVPGEQGLERDDKLADVLINRCTNSGPGNQGESMDGGEGLGPCEKRVDDEGGDGDPGNSGNNNAPPLPPGLPD